MNLPQQSIEQILGSSAVNREFGEKIKELDRRLKMNGMSYPGYESMTDRQQEILTQGLFLEPESAIGMDEYVKTAVDNCGCEDVKEDLHHHSPILMREIETEKEKLPDLKIRIGESLSGLDQAIDLLLEQILQEQEPETEDTPEEAVQNLERYAAMVIFKKPNVSSAIKAASQRGGRHLRQQVPGDNKAVAAFFKKYGLSLEKGAAYDLSSKYGEFTLEATKDIPFKIKVKGKEYELSVPKGTKLPYVNPTAASSAEKTGKEITFVTKELSPDGLGLSGKTFDSVESLIKAAAAAVKEKYPNQPEKIGPLTELLKDAYASKGNRLDLSEALVFGREDLATISKDYGEILAAIWAINNLEFSGVEFPAASNEPLIDIYGLTDTKGGVDKTPISVKSGKVGGKVSIVNIIEALAKQGSAGDDAVDNNAEYAMDVFRAVEQNSAKEGLIAVHKLMNDEQGSKIINELSEVIGISVAKMDLKSIQNWTNNSFAEDPAKFKEDMDNWYSKFTYGKPKEKFRRTVFEQGIDTRGAILSPLGFNAVVLLNGDQQMKDSLTSLARQVLLLQAKVNVKKAFMEIRADYFKDAKFKFNWTGYQAGNKLGFNMDFTE